MQRLAGARPGRRGRRLGPDDDLASIWQAWLGRTDGPGLPPLTTDGVLSLQASAGNAAVAGLLEGGPMAAEQDADGPESLDPNADGVRPDGADRSVQRAVPEAEEAGGAGSVLRYSLFQNDEYLEMVAGGGALLAKGSPAAGPVRLIQAALLVAVPAEDLGTTGLVGAGLDGDFGPKTEKAVQAFQAAEGLATDGIVGPLTMRRLDDVLVTRTLMPADDDTVPAEPGDASRLPENPKGGNELPKVPAGGNIGDLSGFGVSVVELDASEPDGGLVKMEGEPTERPNVHLRGSAGANLEVGYALVPRPAKKGSKAKGAPVWGAEVKYLLVKREIEVDSNLPSIAEIGCELSSDQLFLRNREAVAKTGDVADLDLMKTLDWSTKDATLFHETLHTVSFHNTIRAKLEHKYRKAVKAIAQADDGGGDDVLEATRAKFRDVTKHEIQIPWRGLEKDDRTAWHAHWDIRLAQFYFLVQQYNHWLQSGTKGSCRTSP